MIIYEFLSKEELSELKSIVRCPGEDHGIARRCNALLLLDDGKNCQQIAKVKQWLERKNCKIYSEQNFQIMA